MSLLVDLFGGCCFGFRAIIAAGFGGNYIVVIPDKNIVVVTRWLEPKKLDEFIERLYKVI